MKNKLYTGSIKSALKFLTVSDVFDLFCDVWIPALFRVLMEIYLHRDFKTNLIMILKKTLLNQTRAH